MGQKKLHGVISQNRKVPGRILNIKSKKNITNNRIKLDRLLKKSKPKILLKRRLGGIGDVIMSTPILKHLKRLIPNCEITYATDLDYSWGALKKVMEHNPYVDIIVGNKQFKETDYDYSVDITATGLNREKAGTIPPNRIDMFAEEVGIDVSSDPIPDWIVTVNEREEIREWIKQYIPKGKKREDYNLIMLQCRSNDARRTWPLEHVDSLADLLIEKDEKNIVFLMDWGGTVDRWVDRERVYAIKDQVIEETAAFMEQCDLVICPDSSLLHLAGALNKKTVTVFGPIPPDSRVNYYPNCTAVYRKLPCSFCFYTPKCSSSNNTKLECLTKLMPETVLEAVEKKMKEKDKTLENTRYGSNMTKKGQDNIILVVRKVGGLGDILMTGPAIKTLKDKYPNKKIHFAIPKQYHPLMKNLDFIDTILDSNKPINYKRYFMISDITNVDAYYESTRVNAGKTVQKSRIEIYAEALGIRNLLTEKTPIYNVSEDEEKWAAGLLSSKKLNKNKKTIALTLKSAERYRDYPTQKYQELFSLLKRDYNLVLLGELSNEKYYDIIDARGLSIRELGAVISLCDCLITVDTGPLHLAAALGVKTIALFGPIDANARCKGYKNVLVVKSNMDCIPCWRNNNIKCKQIDNNNYSKCLSSISPNNIYKIVKGKV